MLYNVYMRFFKKILTILAIFMLCACSSSSYKQYSAYTIYPIGFLLDNIGGNKIKTISIQNGNKLVQASSIIEDYKEVLADSSVLFHIGDLEPYMDVNEESIKETGIDLNNGDLSVLNLSYEYKRYTPVYQNGNILFVEGEFYDDERFNAIDTYDLDPFIWLSPGGMYSMATDVYEYLSNNYVEQSAFFKQKYDELSDKLINLEASYQNLANRLVKENKTIKFVSMTASFAPWQKNFGIQIYPVCISKYGALPSKSELQVIKDRIINDDVKYIAFESNMPDYMVDLFLQLEDELNLKRVNLNNISSLTQAQVESGKDYLSLMYENLNILENMATPILSPTPIVESNEE